MTCLLRAIGTAAAVAALALAPAAFAQTCTPIDHCIAESCANGAAATCDQCASGYFVAADGTCQSCTAVDKCTEGAVVCTNAQDSTCTQCQSGSYAVSKPDGGTVCTDCTPISGCNSPITCTNADNSQCTSCDFG